MSKIEVCIRFQINRISLNIKNSQECLVYIQQKCFYEEKKYAVLHELEYEQAYIILF